ncbi:hypothetical protein AR463_04200 [Ralstonia solanacearum]|nr:hypothetical protein RSUY_08620 [Ralstonia solanacearum]ATI26779.1 hypothetical protein CCY86_04305 [Ralstonia solanacearum]KEI31858.1 hypothetical protein CQ06_20240 [Ralstonia solanacearum]OCQ59446.1 hypothetical protein AR463_04200 [Ralstonia solanacearum]OCQ71090.1 hypothetical protein AR464_02440 [Ralstonia solanacearum]
MVGPGLFALEQDALDNETVQPRLLRVADEIGCSIDEARPVKETLIYQSQPSSLTQLRPL